MREEKYKYLCAKKSDINEHLTVLRKYGEQCNHITEFGVRWIVSTWAFLASQPDFLISYDIRHPSSFKADIDNVYASAGKTEYNFIQADVLKIELEETDLLFIDTLHRYNQLKKELQLHASKVKKYIILHDTETFGEKGEGKGEGLQKAIDEFLYQNENWRIKEIFTNNNGLTILENHG
jgi:hypothetical protein